MTKKDLVLVAKALNEVLELDEEDAIDTDMSPKELEKELKQCIGGKNPELEIMADDDFDDKTWVLLAELGNETAKKKLEKPAATKTRKKVVEPEVVESEEEEEETTEDDEEDSDEEDSVGTGDEDEETTEKEDEEPVEAPKIEAKKPAKEKKGRRENERRAPEGRREDDVKIEKKTKSTPPKKRVVTVIEAIELLCPKGATTAEIYQKADEIYANSGGKAGSIATNVTKNSIQVLQHFGILTENDGKLYI